MGRFLHPSFSSYHMNRPSFFQKIYTLCTYTPSVALPELQRRVENATTPASLEKAVNALQTRLWRLPRLEQLLAREQLISTLQYHTLHARNVALRLKAAQWLRFLVQAGLVAHPQEIFVTLVMATVQTLNADEQKQYLKETFDCFWPFRHPYTLFSCEQFPTNAVFFPLATLLSGAEHDVQELILLLFAELPSLDDKEICTTLLPLALHWAKQSDPESRRLIAPILARMQHPDAQTMLAELQKDTTLAVRLSALNAAHYITQ